MVLSSDAIGIAASMTPECTEPTMNSALPRWIRLRSLRAPGAGLDSVSSVTSSTLRPAMPPPLLITLIAALAHLSCQKPHDEMTPVRSQWCPITIGPEACANRSLVMVRLATPAAPPASAVSRKLRRDNFRCLMLFSSRDIIQWRMFLSANRCPSRIKSRTGFRRKHTLAGHSQIAMHDLGLRFEVVRGAAVDDGALLHQEHAGT